jgi:HSP20 family protein
MLSKKGTSRQDFEAQEPYFHIVASGQQYLVVRRAHAWRPPTDVMEDESHLYVIVEIAGMRHGEFNVSVSDRRLTITGIRPLPSRARAAYHQLEVRFGEFRTDVALPWTVDEESIVARYVDGFLYIDLPRKQTDRGRMVPVEKDEESE